MTKRAKPADFTSPIRLALRRCSTATEAWGVYDDVQRTLSRLVGERIRTIRQKEEADGR